MNEDSKIRDLNMNVGDESYQDPPSSPLQDSQVGGADDESTQQHIVAGAPCGSMNATSVGPLLEVRLDESPWGAFQADSMAVLAGENDTASQSATRPFSVAWEWHKEIPASVQTKEVKLSDLARGPPGSATRLRRAMDAIQSVGESKVRFRLTATLLPDESSRSRPAQWTDAQSSSGAISHLASKTSLRAEDVHRYLAASSVVEDLMAIHDKIEVDAGGNLILRQSSGGATVDVQVDGKPRQLKVDFSGHMLPAPSTGGASTQATLSSLGNPSTCG